MPLAWPMVLTDINTFVLWIHLDIQIPLCGESIWPMVIPSVPGANIIATNLCRYLTNASLQRVPRSPWGFISMLTHWSRVTHICVRKLTNIASDNGLSPGRRQAIIWTNAGILLIGPIATNFSENLIGIQTFSSMKMPLKMSSAKWRPFCLGLNVLTPVTSIIPGMSVSGGWHLVRPRLQSNMYK